MKKISLAFVRGFMAILLFGTSNSAFSQFSWIKEFKGKDFIAVHELSIDKEDNIYVVGGFSSDFQVENYEYEYEKGGAFLLKLNTSGELIWHNLFTSEDDYMSLDRVKTDAFGNVYVSGVFRTSFKVNNQNIFGNGYGSFIAKFDSNSNIVWIKTFNALQFVADFSVNSMGQVVMYSINSKGSPVTTTNNGFAVLYDSDGTLLWSKIFSTTESTVPIAVSLDNFGNSYFTGYYSGPLTIDNKSISLDSNRDIFLAKMDQSGNCVLLKNFQREAHPLVASLSSGEYGTISVDNDQNIYIASAFWTSIHLDSYTFNGDPLYSRIFATKLDEQGNVLWASTINDIDNNGNSTALKFFPKNGNVYLSGTIGKKGFFSILNDPQPALINPVYLPFEFVDNPLGGLGLDSHGNIYGSGRLNADIYSGFLFRYNMIDPNIKKGYPIVSKKSYCRESNQIFLHTEFLPNATAYKWEITLDGKITRVITSTSEILINLSELGITGDFSIQVRGENKNGAGPYSESKEILLNYSDISSILIPNIITPNNDALNDHFVVDDAIKSSSISIYNRWGKQVYQSSIYDNTWSAEGLENGTYYYTIQSKCLPDPIKGWIAVKR